MTIYSRSLRRTTISTFFSYIMVIADYYLCLLAWNYPLSYDALLARCSFVVPLALLLPTPHRSLLRMIRVCRMLLVPPVRAACVVALPIGSAGVFLSVSSYPLTWPVLVQSPSAFILPRYMNGIVISRYSTNTAFIKSGRKKALVAAHLLPRPS